VGWRDRLIGIFHSPYQPTEPALFQEMIAQLPSELNRFVFVDLGSGKGRALLMASDYPFRRILGVELLPELDRVAQENIRRYKNPSQRCATIESICADARGFEFPDDPLVLYLFNPLPEDGLIQVMESLSRSLGRNPREVWVVYHNPVLERVLASNPALKRVGGTAQYVLYRSVAAS
jgi:SAM-dependent methyltransferase